MQQSEIILYIIKLLIGGIVAFLAIALWSKTRDAAWMAIVAASVTSYAGIVYDMVTKFGIVFMEGIMFFGINLSTLLFTVIPGIFYIIAFIIMLRRSGR